MFKATFFLFFFIFTNYQGGTHSFPIWELFTVLKNDAVLFEFDENID